MSSDPSGTFFVRVQSLKSSMWVALYLAFLPVAIAVSLWFAVLPKTMNPSTALDYLRGAASGFGVDMLSDAPWIIPSLLGLLVAVYASDYGARKQLDPLGASEVRSREEGIVLGALNALAVLISAFALDYLLLTTTSILFQGRGYGHIVGLTFLCAVIFLLGVSVGLFAIATPERLLDANERSAKRLRDQLERMSEPKGARRPGVVVAIWLLWPLVVMAASIAWVAVMPRAALAQWAVYIGLAVVSLGLGSAAQASFWRASRQDPGDVFYRIARAVTLAIYLIYVTAIGTVFALVFFSRSFGLVAGCATLLLVAAQLVFWWIPQRYDSRVAGQPWAPGAAQFQLIRRSAIRRSARVAAERNRLLDYRNEVKTARRGARDPIDRTRSRASRATSLRPRHRGR